MLCDTCLLGGKHSLVLLLRGRSGLVVRVSLSARMAGGRNGTCRGDSGLSFAVALVRGRVTAGVVEGVTGIQVMRIHVDQPLQ